jgi:copper(I)-binding protein
MTTFSKTMLLAFLLTTASLGSLAAQEFKAGDLTITQPWSRATPPSAKVAAGYMTITNNGSAADRLVGASTSSAGRVEIHEMAMKDNVMTMRPVSGGLAIEPGKSVALAPGGYHLMMMDLKSPLKKGDKLSATLDFEKAGKVEVTFDVQAVGAASPAASSGQKKAPSMAPGHKM